jgi:glycosyltransferase involved in cell wall biosynthesis
MDYLVSIIIPCYNQDEYVGEALQSVLEQTFSNWECIIVDDGSTDNSAKIIAGYLAKDFRFTYVYKKNRGVSSARNFGIETAKGQFIQFLDADDVLDSKKIQYSVNELKKNNKTDIQIVVTNFKMMSSDSKEFYPAFCELTNESLNFDNFLYNFFSIQLQCGFFNKILFENIRFPESLTAQEDWIVWVSILKNNPNYIFIDLPLAFYRINPTSRMNTIGADDNQIKVLNCLKEILTYEQFYQFSVNIVTKNFSKNKTLNKNLNTLKKSSEYKTGLLIKKVLKKVGLIWFLKKKTFNPR